MLDWRYEETESRTVFTGGVNCGNFGDVGVGGGGESINSFD